MTDHTVFPAQRSSSPSEVAEPQRPLIYRRTSITTDHIGRFVAILIRELLEREGVRYDAVYAALAESGIQPLPTFQCEAVHFDVRMDRQNTLADVLIETIATDEVLRARLTSLATTVLNLLTSPAPDEHATHEELYAFWECCSPGADEHIGDQDRYAAIHAHIGTCSQCDERLQERSEGKRRQQLISPRAEYEQTSTMNSEQ